MEQPTTATLLCGLQDSLQAAGLTPREIGLFSVSRGPGSFTGLRAGLTVAKTFAWLTGCRLASIDTHLILAAGLAEEDRQLAHRDTRQIATVINAQRNEWFAQIWQIGGDGLEVLAGNRIVRPEQFLEGLPRGSIVNGPGLSRLPASGNWQTRDLRICQPAWRMPRASVIGQLGWQESKSGRTTDPLSLVPLYGRLSAAEEKRSGA